MKTALFTTVLLIASVTARAQNAGCPIQPTLVKNTDALAVDFKNASGKPIVSYQFGLAFFDLNGKAHAFPQPLTGNVQVSSKAHRTAVWQNRLALHFLFPYAKAFLQQATFADGTSWVDDGSHACSIISVQE